MPAARGEGGKAGHDAVDDERPAEEYEIKGRGFWRTLLAAIGLDWLQGLLIDLLSGRQVELRWVCR